MESFRLYAIRQWIRRINIAKDLIECNGLCRDDQNYTIRAKNILRALMLNLLDLDDKKNIQGQEGTY